MSSPLSLRPVPGTVSGAGEAVSSELTDWRRSGAERARALPRLLKAGATAGGTVLGAAAAEGGHMKWALKGAYEFARTATHFTDLEKPSGNGHGVSSRGGLFWRPPATPRVCAVTPGWSRVLGSREARRPGERGAGHRPNAQPPALARATYELPRGLFLLLRAFSSSFCRAPFSAVWGEPCCAVRGRTSPP